MPIVVTLLGATLLGSGLPISGPVPPRASVSEATATSAGPPVAGPPAPADGAGPPVAAPAEAQAAELAPGSLPGSTSTALPTTAGLSRALSEARTQQESEGLVADSAHADAVPHVYRLGAYNAPHVEDPPALQVSGYGGVSVRGSSIGHNPAVWVGGRAGLLFGHHFSIGGAFYEVRYRHGGPIVDPAGRALGIRAAYGGLQLGYGLFNRDRFHLDLDVLIGGGAACISSDPRYRESNWRCIESVKMFVTEPALSARFDVLEWFRLGLSAGYRFASREAWRPPNDFQLSGPYVGLDFDFGWFALAD